MGVGSFWFMGKGKSKDRLSEDIMGSWWNNKAMLILFNGCEQFRIKVPWAFKCLELKDDWHIEGLLLEFWKDYDSFFG
jgi:hypothetical protein